MIRGVDLNESMIKLIHDCIHLKKTNGKKRLFVLVKLHAFMQRCHILFFGHSLNKLPMGMKFKSFREQKRILVE